MAGRLSTQSCWAGLGLFEGRPRRSVSSDALNGSPVHALYMVRNRPKWREMLDVQGATTTAALNARKLLFQPH